MESGRPYSLVEIFYGKKQIIIPDLQRDYCWGSVNGLAENFTQSLIDLFEKGNGAIRQCSLGLIYAYENPTGFVNIADGQQRLTTIYLLLCVLYRRLAGDERKEISSFLAVDEEEIIKEPRLRYEVRESTLYFMKDFLNEVLSDNKVKFKELMKVNWFRDEYRHDPSIKSMVEAVKKIDEKLDITTGIEWRNFARFILGHAPESFDRRILADPGHDNTSLSRLFAGHAGICFVYFDVRNREFGEQMYVIINTRGAPMEPNEHIKPLLLSKLDKDDQNDWTEKWEAWQDFYWQKRLVNEDSADEGFNVFLKWYVQIQNRRVLSDKDDSAVYAFFSKSDPKAQISLLEQYVHATQLLWCHFDKLDGCKDILLQLKPEAKNLRDLNFDRIQFVVWPMLAFMVKFPDNTDDHYRMLRLLRRNLFDQAWKNQAHQPTTRPDYIKWNELLEKIEEAESANDLLGPFGNDEDEQWKTSLSQEKIIALEAHKALGGRLDLIRELCGEDMMKFNAVYDLWLDKNLLSQGNLLRRSLLCFGDYFPNNHTACKNEEWHLLVFHPEKKAYLIALVEALLKGDGKKTLNESLEGIIEEKVEALAEGDWRRPFIVDGRIFNHCRHQVIDAHISGKTLIRASWNPSNFTTASTFYVSEPRMCLFRELQKQWTEDGAQIYVVANGKELPLHEKTNDEFVEWMTVGISKYDDKALLAISSNGIGIQMGLRKGPDCEKKDDALSGQLNNCKDIGANWKTQDAWWYLVRWVNFIDFQSTDEYRKFEKWVKMPDPFLIG
jgi:hypothetical protein